MVIDSSGKNTLFLDKPRLDTELLCEPFLVGTRLVLIGPHSTTPSPFIENPLRFTDPTGLTDVTFVTTNTLGRTGPQNASVTKFNSAGDPTLTRFYDVNGDAILDIAWTDHGNPKIHSDPHYHTWEDGSHSDPINNPDDLPDDLKALVDGFVMPDGDTGQAPPSSGGDQNDGSGESGSGDSSTGSSVFPPGCDGDPTGQTMPFLPIPSPGGLLPGAGTLPDLILAL